MPIGPVKTAQPPFYLEGIELRFSVKWPFTPVMVDQLDPDGNPVLDAEGNPVQVQDVWALADGTTVPRVTMGSTYLQGHTVDGSGMRGPSIEGNETDLTADFLLAIYNAAMAPTGLPALLAKTVGDDGVPTIAGVLE